MNIPGVCLILVFLVYCRGDANHPNITGIISVRYKWKETSLLYGLCIISIINAYNSQLRNRSMTIRVLNDMKFHDRYRNVIG